MNNLEAKIEQITEKLTDDESNLFLNNMFPYIMTKADSFLTEGSDEYRSTDAFGFPLENWTSNDLDLIKNGCAQVLNGTGFLSDKPFTDLGVRGFNLLFTMFHYRSVKRKTKRLGLGKMLDEITFEHAVQKNKVTYFNLVERK